MQLLTLPFSNCDSRNSRWLAIIYSHESSTPSQLPDGWCMCITCSCVVLHIFFSAVAEPPQTFSVVLIFMLSLVDDEQGGGVLSNSQPNRAFLVANKCGIVPVTRGHWANGTNHSIHHWIIWLDWCWWLLVSHLFKYCSNWNCCFALLYSAPSSASAVDDITAWMMVDKFKTAPLFERNWIFSDKKWCPPAQLFAPCSLKYDASLCITRTMLLAWYMRTVCSWDAM